MEGFCQDSSKNLASLEAKLLAAHAAGDKAALVALYTAAADAAGSVDAECFFLTQAYIYALDIGDARAWGLKSRLVARGRET